MTFLLGEAVTVVACVVLWGVSIWRCRRSLSSSGPDRSAWCAISFLAAAATLDLPPVQAAVDGWAGHPATSTMLTNVCVATAGFFAADTWRRVAGGSAAWSHRVALLAVVATAAAALLSSPGAAAVESPREFYDPNWPAAMHWITYLSFMTWTIAGSLGMCIRYRRLSDSDLVRTGMTLLAAGCAGGLLFVAWRVTVLLSIVYAGEAGLVRWDTLVAAAVIGPSLLLVVIGASWQVLSARGHALRLSFDAWVALRRLRGLWESLVAVAPDVVLDPPLGRWVEGWLPGRVQLRLHRRVIEIRDGIAAVGAYVPSAAQAGAEQLALTYRREAVDRAAAAEAAWLALGCRLVASGGPLVSQPAWPRDASRNVVEEARWLVQVARAAPFAAWAAERLEADHQRQLTRL